MAKGISVEPFHPGEYLKDELDARGWTLGDLAQIMKRNVNTINRLVLGKTSVTPETAKELAAALGQNAQTWMNLQSQYELAAAAKDCRDGRMTARN